MPRLGEVHQHSPIGPHVWRCIGVVQEPIYLHSESLLDMRRDLMNLRASKH